MKNNLFAIIIILFFAAIIWSCQSDDNEPEILKESLTINDAINWVKNNFNQSASNLENFRANATDSTIFDLKPSLNWDLAEIDNEDIWSVVELPWEYENGFITRANPDVKNYSGINAIQKNFVQKLVILKNRISGDVYGFKMSVIPDYKYLLQNTENINSNYYLKRDPQLSGIVLFYSIKDEFINGWKFDEGKIVSKIETKISDSPVNISEYQKASSMLYYTIETCYYYYVTGGGYTTEPKLMYCNTEYFYILMSDISILDSNGGGVDLSVFGGAGGSNTQTTDKPSDPCAEIKKAKADAALNERLKDLIRKAKYELNEDGYLMKNDGSFIFPKTREFGNVKFEFSTADKFSEFVHLHQDVSGGTCVFSGKDLITLYSMFINNRMVDPATFRYLVVSSFGVGSLHITDPVAFKNFGDKYNKEILDKLYITTPRDGNNINDYLKQFLDILKNTNAGLTFSLGEFDMESSNPEIKWNTKQFDALGNVVNLNCN